MPDNATKTESPKIIKQQQHITQRNNNASALTAQDYFRLRTGLAGRQTEYNGGGWTTDRSNPSEMALAAKIHRTYGKPNTIELNEKLRANLQTAG